MSSRWWSGEVRMTVLSCLSYRPLSTSESCCPVATQAQPQAGMWSQQVNNATWCMVQCMEDVKVLECGIDWFQLPCLYSWRVCTTNCRLLFHKQNSISESHVNNTCYKRHPLVDGKAVVSRVAGRLDRGLCLSTVTSQLANTLPSCNAF